MRHPYRLCIALLFIFANVQAQAQELSRYVNANGGDEFGDTYTHTIGQAVVGQLQNNQLLFSQGYQQTHNQQTVGIVEYSQLESIDIFPNPASEWINVHFQAVNTVTGQVQLRSILGQLISILPFENENQLLTRLRVDHLPAGFYTLSLIDNNRNFLAIQKILITK